MQIVGLQVFICLYCCHIVVPIAEERFQYAEISEICVEIQICDKSGYRPARSDMTSSVKQALIG